MSDEYFASYKAIKNNHSDTSAENTTTHIMPMGKGSFADLLFTTKSGIGWVGAAAMPTGWALVSILVVMIFFSLPFIRKKGHFEVFVYIFFW